MAQFKSFVSEAELEERRQRRQEEWEKVRKPEDPQEVPEEEYDHRSLYERLQEQKDRKQVEYEEAHKLKNMIRGLDDDEVQFLDLVDRTKEEMEVQRWKEEFKEIKEYRKAVADLAEQAANQRLQDLKKAATNHLNSSSSSKKTHSSVLAGLVKRKSSSDKPEESNKRFKENSENSDNPMSSTDADNVKEKEEGSDKTTKDTFEDGLSEKSDEKSSSPVAFQQTTCIGILPGLGAYSDSSDSENSSASDLESGTEYDLVGRSRWQTNNHNHT